MNSKCVVLSLCAVSILSVGVCRAKGGGKRANRARSQQQEQHTDAQRVELGRIMGQIRRAKAQVEKRNISTRGLGVDAAPRTPAEAQHMLTALQDRLDGRR